MKRKIHAEVIYPTWVEIEVDPDIDSMDDIRRKIINIAGYYMEQGSIKPEVKIYDED